MRRTALAAAALLAASGPAPAHTVIDGVGGFPGGLLHPLLVPAHALLLMTLGLLAGRESTQCRMLVLLFALALVAAVALIAAAVAGNTQAAILWLCAVGGALLALGWPLPAVLAAALVATGAVALMLDSVPAVLSVQETLSALGGTAISAFALFTLFAAFSARATRPWQQIGRRIVGSWAAASAILVLALRFVT